MQPKRPATSLYDSMSTYDLESKARPGELVLGSLKTIVYELIAVF
jgi:hypothetical protein